MDEINSLADLRSGDIGLMRMGGFIPGFLPVRLGQMLCKESFQVGPFSADHALICVEAGRPAGSRITLGAGDQMDARAPRAVQAMPRGAEEIALTPAKHWTDSVAWFRPTEDYPGQAEDAATIARMFVTEKVPYSFLSYLALAAWSRGWKTPKLEAWINRRGEERMIHFPIPYSPDRVGKAIARPIALPREAICSVLVDQAWTLAGKRVMTGVKRQCVTPGALAIELDRTCKAYGPRFLVGS